VDDGGVLEDWLLACVGFSGGELLVAIGAAGDDHGTWRNSDRVIQGTDDGRGSSWLGGGRVHFVEAVEYWQDPALRKERVGGAGG
jgi:hypothetical protein